MLPRDPWNPIREPSILNLKDGWEIEITTSLLTSELRPSRPQDIWENNKSICSIFTSKNFFQGCPMKSPHPLDGPDNSKSMTKIRNVLSASLSLDFGPLSPWARVLYYLLSSCTLSLLVCMWYYSLCWSCCSVRWRSTSSDWCGPPKSRPKGRKVCNELIRMLSISVSMGVLWWVT